LNVISVTSPSRSGAQIGKSLTSQQGAILIAMAQSMM
jgi:hypothetical protein